MDDALFGGLLGVAFATLACFALLLFLLGQRTSELCKRFDGKFNDGTCYIVENGKVTENSFDDLVKKVNNDS